MFWKKILQATHVVRSARNENGQLSCIWLRTQPEFYSLKKLGAYRKAKVDAFTFHPSRSSVASCLYE